MKRIGSRQLRYWRIMHTPLSAWRGWQPIALWLPVLVVLGSWLMAWFWR